MKIAINKCYGGFSLSKEAYEFMGIPWDGYGSKFSDHDERTNAKLIECIETLGDKASGGWSKIIVVEIPDDVNWEIEEYDGVEWVSEVHLGLIEKNMGAITMRLWHTDLIPVLPRQQLLGQWRELNSIFKKQDKHLLINFVYDYPKEDLYNYSSMVIGEMYKRKYKINLDKFLDYFKDSEVDYVATPFPDKMTDKYLAECYFNLMEKHDCGGVTDEEWEKIDNVARERVKKCVLNNL